MKLPFLIAGATLVIIALVEIIGLVYVYNSVDHFAAYWQKRQAEPGELLYVAMGDSAAQGIGASRAQHSYVGVIANRLENETGKKVRVVNLSKTGARITDVIQDQLPQLSNLPTPDLITIEIGANDVNGFDAVAFETDFELLVRRLPPGAYISDLPDFGERSPSIAAQREGAEIARRIIGQHRDVHLVELEHHTRNEFSHWLHYSFDFFHPNNTGYRVWADAFWQEIKKEHPNG